MAFHRMVPFRLPYTHGQGGRGKSPGSHRESRVCDEAEGHSEGLLLGHPFVPFRIRGGGLPESGVHREAGRNQYGYPAVWLLRSG